MNQLAASMRRLSRSIFARNVFVFMSGAAAAQVINVAASPILSRLYEPEAFGQFALFVSVVSLLEIVVTGRYEQAIVLPDNEADAVNLMGLSFFLTVTLSGLTAVLIWLGGKTFVNWFNTSELAPWLWLIPPYLLLSGTYSSLNYWSTRHTRFHRLSISQVFGASGAASIQVIIGILRSSAGGLIGGKVIGQSFSSGVLFFQVWREDRHTVRQLISPAHLMPLARKYRNFPRYGAPQALLNSLSLGLFTFLMTPFFGPAVVGYYALTKKVLALPARLFGEAIRQVFFPKASELWQTGGNVYQFLKTMTLTLLAVGLLPTLVIMLFGPQLFAFVFGAEWYQAGVYARYIVLWTYISLANPPSVMMVPILNKQSAYMSFEITSLAARTAVIFVGVVVGSDVVAVALFSAVGFLLNLGLILYVMRLTRQQMMTAQPASPDRFLL